MNSLSVSAAVRVLAVISIYAGATASAKAAEITLRGWEVAQAMTQVFANTRVRLNSQRQAIPYERGCFHDRGNSYIAFESPITRYRHRLKIPQQNTRTPMTAVREFEEHLYFNIADMNVDSVTVAAGISSFSLVFNLEREGSEGQWTCQRFHRAPGRDRRECPESIEAADAGNWNRPVEWTSPQVIVKLVPIVIEGRLGFRATDIRFAGRLSVPDCPSSNTSQYCGFVRNYIDDLNASNVLDVQIDDAFDSREVRFSLAIAMIQPLRNLGITGRIRDADMEDRNLVIVTEGPQGRLVDPGHIPGDHDVIGGPGIPGP